METTIDPLNKAPLRTVTGRGNDPTDNNPGCSLAASRPACCGLGLAAFLETHSAMVSVASC